MISIKTEADIVQDRLVVLLQQRSELLARRAVVPDELVHAIEEVNKDLEFLGV